MKLGLLVLFREESAAEAAFLLPEQGWEFTLLTGDKPASCTVLGSSRNFSSNCFKGEGSGCQDSYVLIPGIAQQLRTLTSLQPEAMSLCTCRTSGDKRSTGTPVLSSSAPHMLCRGLSCERRVEDSQQAGSVASRSYAWQCSAEVCTSGCWYSPFKNSPFFHQGNEFISGPGLAALFQPDVFIPLPPPGLTSCIQGSQSFPRLMKSGKSITTSLLLQWLITSHYISLKRGMYRILAFQLVCYFLYLLAESLLKNHIFCFNSPMMVSPLCCM